MTPGVPAWQRHWHWTLAAALLLVAGATLASLCFGAVAISAADVGAWLLGRSDPQATLILTQLRLPRALLALIVGALLASSGAVAQGLFRNPLADPSLIGVTAGATAGASAVIVLIEPVHGDLGVLSLVSLGAFIGGLATVALVYRLATSASGTSVATMLLAGIACTFIASALTDVLEFIADNELLRRISLWRMGGLDAADGVRVTIAAAVAAVCACALPVHRAHLNAMLLGESEARHLGVDVDRVKRQLILLVAVAVGTSVALAGTISFVGLVVPHLVRLITGPDHRWVLPLSACSGALLLLLADVGARTVIAPTELPVGVVTALIGAPLFIALLRRRHRLGVF